MPPIPTRLPSTRRSFHPSSRRFSKVSTAPSSPMARQALVCSQPHTYTCKTYTMEGVAPGEISPNMRFTDLPADTGIIPRAVSEIFDSLSESGADFTVRISHLELYNEHLLDLLAEVKEGEPNAEPRIFSNRAVPGCPTVVQGLEEFVVSDAVEVLNHLERSTERRTTSATDMNARSSRSHCIFSITVHVRESSAAGEELLKIGKLNLVDLAGSESAALSGAVERGNVKQQKEGRAINQSLLTLGKVIRELSQHERHISYRDSKLTRLLQESLGGKAKTTIIATVSPASDCIAETQSTLRYAAAAMQVQNNPEANERRTKKEMLREYMGEIEALQRELAAARRQDGVWLDPTHFDKMKEDEKAMENNLKELETTLAGLHEQFEMVSKDLAVTQKEKDATLAKLRRAETELKATTSKLGAEIVVNDELETKHGQLKQTAVTAITSLKKTQGDLEGMFSKLNRAHDHETINLVAIEQGREDLGEGLRKMQDSVSTQGSIVAEWVDSVDTIFGRFNETRRQLGKDVATAQRNADVACSQIPAVLKESCDNVYSEVNQAISVEAEDIATLKPTFDESLMPHIESVTAMAHEIRDNATRIKDEARRLNEYGADACAEVEGAGKSLVETLKEILGPIEEEGEELVATVETRVTETENARLSVRSALQTQLADFKKRLLTVVEEAVDANSAAILDSIDSHLHMERDTSTATRDDLTAFVASVTRKASGAMLTVEESVDSIKSHIKTISQSVKESHDLTVHVACQVDETVPLVVEEVHDITSHASNAVAGLTDRLIQNGKWADGVVSELATMVDTEAQAGAEAVSAAISQLLNANTTLDSASEAVLDATKTAMAEHAEITHEVLGTVTDDIKALKQTVEVLGETVTSLPETGATPKPDRSRVMPGSAAIPSPVERVAVVNSFREQFGTPSVALNLRRRVGLEVPATPSRLSTIGESPVSLDT
ncbi:Kinesin motor domain [Carpediemonas membranifera]|uniref:Kinesin-like protein n=1 Tax=Carpediemonas membranifera TaxID=201153 RepID=A0A8J6B892_9EUKA|nr:Kinesin motor domain [Carpediemonas membranifera]|eukprot:KAG9397668.1 Kinesin motor domain [Carpediemonas membranifera]